jgi:peptidoglycan/xylan/chitin deacetylase (PgdA/CDA1 family)
MPGDSRFPSRRRFLASAVAAGAALGIPGRSRAIDRADDRALIAITLDLEMSRHYPTWDQTHWDYEKGNLDDATKRYAVEAARRVKARGGRVHFFALGRTMEQGDVGWLRTLAEEGHPIGNHSYDHVNVKATRPEDIQFRFRRCPWLIAGKETTEVIAENIRLATAALKTRLGIEPAGFRTPGGFHDGLADRPDVQRMLLAQGFTWVSSRYPKHPTGHPGEPPDEDVYAGLVAAQAQAQPFVYPTGLVEVPMGPISDVTAFRAARWELDAFLEATRRCVAWAIERRAAFDFLAHPSCLLVTDPEFRAIELIGTMVQAAGNRAALVDLGTIAARGVANPG